MIKRDEHRLFNVYEFTSQMSWYYQVTIIIIIIVIIITITYSYSANFIWISRHNAQKRFIVFIMDWSQQYRYFVMSKRIQLSWRYVNCVNCDFEPLQICIIQCRWQQILLKWRICGTRSTTFDLRECFVIDKCFLVGLKHNFTFIGITETWLTNWNDGYIL